LMTGGALLGSLMAPGVSPLAKSSRPATSLALMRERQGRWLETAQSLIPALGITQQAPVSLVHPVADEALPLRFRMEPEAPAVELENRLLKQGDSFILDFEGHRTGHLAFELAGEGRGVDAPVRLRLTFGEVPTDVA